MTLESNGEIYPRKPKDKDDDSLHYPGCWRQYGHHGCAVAEIERLTKLVNQRGLRDVSD